MLIPLVKMILVKGSHDQAGQPSVCKTLRSQHHGSGISNRWRYYCLGAALVFILLGAGIYVADPAVADSRWQMTTELTEANNGSTVDMFVGASLNVLLGVPPEDAYKSDCYWAKITDSDASVLKEVKKAVLLRTGVTAAFFQATEVGIAELESLRQNGSDEGVIRWHVTVRVVNSN
jgi:hypothetical protein